MSDLDFYEEYKDEPEMLALRANREGNIAMLNELFFTSKRFDIQYISPGEKWNWLHLCNVGFSKPSKSVMEFYIAHKVPVNAQDMYGMTPLHYAMRAENGDGALALLEAGADPNIPDRDNVIPLAMMPYMPERLDVLKLMLENGGDVNFFNGDHTVLGGLKKYRSHDTKFVPIIELMEKYNKE